MFSRISYDSFQLLFPMIGFFIFATVFAAAVLKVCLMKKSKVSRLSSLPLEESEANRSLRHNEHA